MRYASKCSGGKQKSLRGTVQGIILVMLCGLLGNHAVQGAQPLRNQEDAQKVFLKIHDCLASAATLMRDADRERKEAAAAFNYKPVRDQLRGASAELRLLKDYYDPQRHTREFPSIFQQQALNLGYLVPLNNTFCFIEDELRPVIDSDGERERRLEKDELMSLVCFWRSLPQVFRQVDDQIAVPLNESFELARYLRDLRQLKPSDNLAEQNNQSSMVAGIMRLASSHLRLPSFISSPQNADDGPSGQEIVTYVRRHLERNRLLPHMIWSLSSSCSPCMYTCFRAGIKSYDLFNTAARESHLLYTVEPTVVLSKVVTMASDLYYALEGCNKFLIDTQPLLPAMELACLSDRHGKFLQACRKRVHKPIRPPIAEQEIETGISLIPGAKQRRQPAVAPTPIPLSPPARQQITGIGPRLIGQGPADEVVNNLHAGVHDIRVSVRRIGSAVSQATAFARNAVDALRFPRLTPGWMLPVLAFPRHQAIMRGDCADCIECVRQEREKKRGAQNSLTIDLNVFEANLKQLGEGQIFAGHPRDAYLMEQLPIIQTELGHLIALFKTWPQWELSHHNRVSPSYSLEAHQRTQRILQHLLPMFDGKNNRYYTQSARDVIAPGLCKILITVKSYYDQQLLRAGPATLPSSEADRDAKYEVAHADGDAKGAVARVNNWSLDAELQTLPWGRISENYLAQWRLLYRDRHRNLATHRERAEPTVISSHLEFVALKTVAEEQLRDASRQWGLAWTRLQGLQTELDGYHKIVTLPTKVLAQLLWFLFRYELPIYYRPKSMQAAIEREQQHATEQHHKLQAYFNIISFLKERGARLPELPALNTVQMDYLERQFPIAGELFAEQRRFLQ